MNDEQKSKLIRDVSKNNFDLLNSLVEKDPTSVSSGILSIMTHRSVYHRIEIRRMIDYLIEKGQGELLVMNKKSRSLRIGDNHRRYLIDIICGYLAHKDSLKSMEYAMEAIVELYTCAVHQTWIQELFDAFIDREKNPELFLIFFECLFADDSTRAKCIKKDAVTMFLRKQPIYRRQESFVFNKLLSLSKIREMISQLDLQLRKEDVYNDDHKSIRECYYMYKCSEAYFYICKAVLDELISRDIIDHVLQKFISFDV